MPAGSDPSGAAARPAPPPLPHTWRPLGPRIAGAVGGGGLLVVLAFLWFSFDQEVQDSVTPFQRGTVAGLVLLGLACLFALIRSRVEAREDRLVVVNGYRRRELAWAEVVGVHLPPGAPWVTLDLADGTTVSAMGIQGSDGLRARQAARQLRALVDRPPA